MAIIVFGIAGFVRKHIFRIEDPPLNQLHEELEEQQWFQEILKENELKDIIISQKRTGLLSDPLYVQKLINHEGTRIGFINYIKGKSNKSD
jgi:hypothetical protein